MSQKSTVPREMKVKKFDPIKLTARLTEVNFNLFLCLYPI